VAALIIGTTSGGALTGAGLAALGAPALKELDADGTATGPLLLAALAIGVLMDKRLLGFRLPSPRRQVNKEWMTSFRGWAYGLGFGLQLGAAMTTIVTSSLTYVAFLGAFLSRSVTTGLLVGGSYGLVRGALVLLTWRITRPQQMGLFYTRIADAERRFVRPAATVQVLVAVVILASMT